MENSGAVTIEGENYEVVDECMDEEDSLNVQNKLIKEEKSPMNVDTNELMKVNTIDQSANDTGESVTDNFQENKKDIVKNEVNVDHKEVEIIDKKVEAINNKEESDTTDKCNDNQDVPCEIIYDSTIDKSKDNVSIMESNLSESKDSIDFTADITLDQLEDSTDMIDREVMLHLDELENMDPSTLQSQDDKQSLDVEIVSEIPAKKEQGIKGEEKNKVDKILGEREKVEWHETKLTQKVNIVKERMSKLARVLEFSYPSYKKWLQNTEKICKSPICKLETAHNYPLNKPHTNRWKFICSRKSVQEVSKDMDSADAFLNKSAETVWQLEPTVAWGVNNISEFPPFVLHAVKIFEDFIRTTEQVESPPVVENFSDDICIDLEQQEPVLEGKLQWLWLLVWCNSMDELMFFVSGRNISRSTMDRLKYVFEYGPGKDSNVKSLYCKFVNKYNNAVVTNTTFLVGSEALDETVGGIKVQLAPKTNFWSNAVGVESVFETIQDLLVPSYKTTILEIGCGIGLIGLMMASKCRQVIGIDSQSEIEEAEMMRELNNIKNASFITGTPHDVASKIVNAVKNHKTSAIINANTNIGRAIEIMTCLRKIVSLSQLVMITTLTKQSVRAILELARPADKNNGHPFVPIKARVVDTQPLGPHFEVIILMRRRIMSKSTQQPHQQNWLVKIVDKLQKAAKEQETKVIPGSNNVATPTEQGQFKTIADRVTPLPKPASAPKVTSITRVAPVPKAAAKRANIGIINAKINSHKPGPNTGKGKFKGKYGIYSGMNETANKKKFDKIVFKPWKAESPKKERPDSHLRINPLYEKKMRERKEQNDVKQKLPSSRVDSEIINKVKEHQAILEIAKEKLSGPAPTVDAVTAKQLQNMLNMVLEQTNKLQNQLPRSVWDRIAPPDNTESLSNRRDFQSDQLPKDRYVQERSSTQDVSITTPVRKFMSNNESMKTLSNIPPLEPNMIMPVDIVAKPERSYQRSSSERYEELNYRMHRQQQQEQQQFEGFWSRDNKDYERSRWNEHEIRKRTETSMKRHLSPVRHRLSSPSRRFSPKRPLLSPPRKPLSPPRQLISPLRRAISPFGLRNEAMGRPLSPHSSSMPIPRRGMSPMRVTISPPRRPMSPIRRPMSPLMRPMSPRRHISPQKQQTSPMRINLTPSRRQISPTRHQMSPRRQMSPPSRAISPRWEILGSRRSIMPERQHVSPMRLASPIRLTSSRTMSPPRRQQSPSMRQMTPPRRYADDWDMPMRGGAAELNNWQNESSRMPEKSWRGERQSLNPNWDHSSSSDNYRNIVNQDKWNVKDSMQSKGWISGRDVWNSKQSNAKQSTKDVWSTPSDNRWTSLGSNKDTWNVRGKESFGNRDEPWIDKNKSRWESSMAKDSWNQQGDKEDWNDLPDDAKDPWSDDNAIGLNERWQKKFDNPGTSSWSRENDKTQPWANKKDSWKNKSQPSGSKLFWKSSNNQSIGDSRWIEQKDASKKFQTSGGSQGGGDVIPPSWQPQSMFSYQKPHSSFVPNQFNDRRC